jgi:glycerol uptake facilitator-like aquaporin
MQKYFAELIGTAVLVMVVVGSGIMGTNLSPDAAIALLVNTISTIFALGLLIAWLGPISGAHFNPAVTWVMRAREEISTVSAAIYTFAQIAGASLGAIMANVMFDLEVLQISEKVRSSAGLWLGEVIATAGLIALILIAVDRGKAQAIPVLVPTWIGSAYIFTSSTSFANPAVTIGRMFSDTFAGIAPASVAGFIAAQAVGAALGVLIASQLTHSKESHVG